MTSKINLTFLGTAGAVPSASKNHTAILLTYEGENILVDCGEGTQRQFRKARLNPCKLTKILITHWHGDHVLGIPGLLQTLAFSGYNKTLHIYGPKGTKNFMKDMFKAFVFSGKLKLEIKEVGPGKFFETKDFYIEAEKMTHGTICNAYNFVKKGHLRIDKKKLSKLKVPSGPHLQKLKEGKNLVFKGKKYLAKNLTYGEASKKVSIILDTSANKKIVPFAKDSDLFICESTFDSNMENEASKYNHLSVIDTAGFAKKAKVKKLVLIHLSQRYDKNPEKILKEAKKIFKNSILAKDLDSIEI